MAKMTNTARIEALENDMNAIKGDIAEIKALLMAQVQASAPAQKASAGKGKRKSAAAKPATKAEAIKAWEAEKGITADSKAKFKQLMDFNGEFYKAHWAARTEDRAYKADLKKFGKQVANKNWHKHIKAMAQAEAAK